MEIKKKEKIKTFYAFPIIIHVDDLCVPEFYRLYIKAVLNAKQFSGLYRYTCMGIPSGTVELNGLSAIRTSSRILNKSVNLKYSTAQ